MASDQVQARDEQRSFAEPLQPGTRLRQYVIQETLGAGGFGITYRAVHATLTDKTFAIKEYFPRAFAIRVDQIVQSTTSQGGRDMFAFGLGRFLQEAEILARCQHPSIVDVTDYFEENGTAYSVLSYVSGTEMSRWLSGLGRLPTQTELDRLVGPLLGALAALHRNNLLHRDIAPDNILVKRDGSPCLIDFGAARADMSVASSATAAFVKTGFSPPEQYIGRADLQGPWTDIYALGATLYRAIAGKSPPEAVARQLDRGFRTAVEAGGGAYRQEFLEAIDWSLALKPENRPQTVAGWRDMLMAGSEPAAPSTAARSLSEATAVRRPATGAGYETRIVDQPRGWPRPNVAAMAGAAVAGAVVLGGAAWFWNGGKKVSGPPPQPLPPPSITVFQTNPAAEDKPAPSLRQVLSSLWHDCLGLDPEAKIAACRQIIATGREQTMPPEDLASAQLNLGIGLKERGAVNEAEQALAEALRLSPRMADAYYHRGSIYASRLQHSRAIEELTRAIDANPNHAEALHLRALSLYRAGRSRDALADIGRALSLYPGRAEFLETRGHVHEALGRKDDAIADFKRALEIDPNVRDSREAVRRLTVPPPPAPVPPPERPAAVERPPPKSPNARVAGRKVTVQIGVSRRPGIAGILDKPYVGANIDPVGNDWSRIIGLPTSEGALVSSILPGSPASRSDLKVGDVILKAGGRLIHSPSDLPAHVSTLQPGTEIALEIWRISDAAGDYLQTLTRLAEAGQIESMTRLGMLLADGSAVARNDVEAMRWLRMAADRGHALAMFQVGQLLQAGRGAVKDAVEGHRWIKKAAEAGIPGAMRALAHNYYRGEGTEKSLPETERWLRAAADANVADAMGDLGDSFWQGLLGAKDAAQAIKWYRLAADAGHFGAMANMGLAYANGTTVAKDPVSAVSWYRRAAEGGNTLAMNNLAVALDQGLGVGRNSEEAAKWMLASIDGNSKFSIDQMQRNPNARSQEFRRALQMLLKDAGFYSGGIDGSFGQATISAVQSYAARRR